MAGFSCKRCGRSSPTLDRTHGEECSHCDQHPVEGTPIPSVPSSQAHDLGHTEELNSSGAVTEAGPPLELNRILAPAKSDDEIGRLNNYRILGVRGSGAMGVVFRAHDPFLDRIVAIKAMRPGMATTSTNRDRFMREARAVAGIRHDHVVTVYGAEETDLVPFLIMEYLEGDALIDLIADNKQLTVEEVLRIGREIADGLDAAHARGLIHRDIKPANLWLQAGSKRVKILDFGLARRLNEHSDLTIPGVVLGTPAFMSPEQGKGTNVTARSDLFSLGAVLYRLCCGKLPFQAPDALSMLNAVAVQVPLPIYRFVSDVPPGLERLIMALLEKDPEKRPATAAAVRDAIDQIIHEEAVGGILGNIDVEETGAIVTLQDDTEEEDVFDADLVEDDEDEVVDGIPVLPLYRLQDLVGHQFGRYTLKEKIGQGRYGVVFRAEDHRCEVEEDRVVAVKLYPAEFPASDVEKGRFVEAMRRALPLRHPNLVPLLTAGGTGPYFWSAMEHVEAESLAHIFAKEPKCLNWKAAVRIAIEISRALRYARRNKLLHREIRPSKILITPCGTARLNGLLQGTAFRWSGVHQAVEDQLGPEDVQYLAPEQIAGEGSYVDHLCDMYTLGVLVYQAATGERPFRGNSLPEMKDAVLAGPLTPPRKLNRSIPKDFEFALGRMMARQQENRYQDFDEALAALEPIGVRCGLVLHAEEDPPSDG